MCDEQSIISYLEEYILICLNEITGIDDKTDFLMGEVYAYIECLEILLKKQGKDNEAILELEKKFGIK